VIEDASHALGAEYKGKRIGALSDMTILSFHPVKHITTGEGGMVLTNSKRYYEKLRVFRHHGIVKNQSTLRSKGSWYYEIPSPGYNFRLTDFQCALGISQLRKLDRFVERRRQIAAAYNKAFAEIDELTKPTELAHVKAAYHIYVVQLRADKLKVGKKEVFEALRAENIGVNVHYIPLHLQPFYEREFGCRRGDYPKAERYYDRAITLPIFPKMDERDTQDVINAVRKVIGSYRKVR
jgi:dTDP-4-amino-4,6-dideoxygalactose transaminase